MGDLTAPTNTSQAPGSDPSTSVATLGRRPLNPLRQLFPFLAATALFLSGIAAPAAHGALVTYFNFEDQNFASDPAVPAPLQSSIITTNFPAVNGFSFPAGAGSTGNLAPGYVQTTNSPLRLDTNQGANNGDYIQFSVNTTGLSNLALTYSTRTTTGFTTETLSYSINGGTSFVTVGTFTPTAAYTTASFALPAAVNNQLNVVLRITFTGAGNDNNKSTDIDNIQLNTPEPATVTTGVLAVLGLCWHQRRRLLKIPKLLGAG